MILNAMSMISRSEFWPILRHILFPDRCLSCNLGLKVRSVISFCQTCQKDIRMIQEPYCTACGMPFDKSAGGSHLCSHCLKIGWHFSRARSVVNYQGVTAKAIQVFKYSGKMYGLGTFAALTRQHYLHQPLPEMDLILPVPLHPERLRQRGFNQALVLSRELFLESKKKIDPHILERNKKTKPQTGLKGSDRRRNVKNAFRVKNLMKIKNKKILLVDDVFTTGATVNECAWTLLKNGAAEVEVFTFARVTDRR
jgi:ComF family protein